ncbi:hypothetical protein HNQ92_005140 [Rhabdobacter roseus]|uniref:Porin n=1 Tax=Rhabdobacter roseus TaxID=1655419 RepID=A0A840U3S6_9BACT|nr:hypothetical protein [Rhabdobacter roseus]MBB5286978.1 hypothetical protein [Rhabdobacter roseus]
MRNKLLPVCLLVATSIFGQVPVDTTSNAKMDALFGRDTTLHTPKDEKMNLDAVYNRPFLRPGKLPISKGGYVEANTQYANTDGVSEGLSFQMRRMTIFMAATINRRIKFLTEIEFEDGTKEINIEFASVDFQFNSLLNLRTGILMNPIGSFNQNHDGPKWEFVDRPLSSTRIIPSTFSNVGFGLYGKKYTRNWVFAYECYLTNGFDNSIIANTQNRTFLPAAKVNPNRFEESFNGVPLVTLKAAVKRRKFGEIGLSWMGGVYNKFRDDGLVLDQRRRVDVWAVDFNTVLPGSRTYLNGEFVWARVDVPSTYSQQFGRRQQGGWLDVVQPVLRGRMLGWNTATLNVAARLERVDYNVGTFNETNENIYDEIWSVVPAISFRPSPTTVIRANYRYQWDTDILGNPPARTAIFQVGFSTYF